MSARPILSNRELEIFLGLAAYGIGALLLWDAYENRGEERPFYHRLIGGLI